MKEDITLEAFMIEHEYFKALVGGGLIGMATSLMLYFDGRIAGISGILNGLIDHKKHDTQWRAAFVAGMLFGAFYLKIFNPEALTYNLDRPTWAIIIAGILVGFGTTLGTGCTSGHGVCGVSRLSKRSIVATALFMTFGMISATIFATFIFKGG